MPTNSGGNNGTVGPITTTATGSAVSVTYPAQPGPPIVPEKTETYDPCPDPFLRRFEQAKAGDDKVNVSCDAAGALSAVTQQ